MSPVSRTVPEPTSVIAQEVARLAATPEVRSALEWFRDQETEFAEEDEPSLTEELLALLRLDLDRDHEYEHRGASVAS